MNISFIYIFLIAMLGILNRPAISEAAIQCYQCHGTSAPVDYRPLDDTHRNISTGGVQGNHRTHMGASALQANCAACHPGSDTYISSHRDGKIKVSSHLNASPLVTTYRGFTSAFSQSVTPSLGVCTNANCHFETATPTWGNAPLTYTNPTTNDCGVCHGAPPSTKSHPYNNTTQKHGAYYGTTTTSCVKCHSDHTAETNRFAHATSAGNRGLVVSFAAAPNNGFGRYTGNINYPNYLPSQLPPRNGTCKSTYCHSPGDQAAASASPPNQTATWGGSLTCKGCHKADSASGDIIATGSHPKHVNPANYNQINCVKCHGATVNSSMAIIDTTVHVNGTVTVKFSNSSVAVGGTYGGQPTPYGKPPGTAYAACDNVYCHSNVQNNGGTGITYKQPTWGSPISGACGSCHSVNASHNPGAEISSGSHTKHLSYDSMTLSKPTKCTQCHNVGGLAFDGTCNSTCHNATAKHANHQIDIMIPSYFGATAHYDGSPNPGSGYSTCGNTYCHSDGQATPVTYATPKWGDPTTAKCGSCHGADAAHPPASPRHPKHMGNTDAYRYSCVKCHSLTANDSVRFNSTTTATINATTGLTYHVNKSRDVKFDAFNPFGNYSNANQSCNSAYCHSLGNIYVTAASLPAVYNGKIYAKPKWSDAGPLACNACHGRSTANGMPDYTGGKMGSMTSNSHPKHVASSAIACVECHEKTTKTNTSIRSTFPSFHVNGANMNVYFNLSGLSPSGVYDKTLKKCSSTYCHGTGASLAWGGATYCNSCHSANDGTSGGGGINNWGTGISAHTLHVEDTTILPWKYTNYSVGNLSASTTTYRFGCASCHNPAQASHVNGYASGTYRAQIFFGFTTAGKKPAYTYTGTAGTADNGFSWSNGNAACNQTYCHSNGAGGNGAAVTWTTAVNSSPSSTRCIKCHNYTTASGSPIATGTHGKHISGSTYSYSCRKCHAATTIDGATIADKTKHVSKSVNVTFNNSTTAVNGTYNGLATPMSKSPGSAYASCGNTYCHSKGTSAASPSAPNITATWGSTLDATCSGCHGNDNSATFKMGTVGSVAHAKHVQTYGYGCVKCHAATVSNNRTISNYANHVTRLVNVAFNNTTTAVNGTYNGSATPTTKLPGSAMGACGNTYCHSLGNTKVDSTKLPGAYGGTIYAAPNWNAVGAVFCNSCHGRSTPGSGITYGMPDYTNGKMASMTSNSHPKHVSGSAIPCSECHEKTTKTNTSIRSTSPSFHVNGANLNVYFNLSGANKNGTYDSTVGVKKCSSTYCHGTLPSVSWGGTTTCISCHGATFTTFSSASKKGAHAQHIETDLNIPTSYMGSGLGNLSSDGTKYQFGCASCHDPAKAGHANAVANSGGGAAEVFFGYTSAVMKGTYLPGTAQAGTDNGFKWTNGAGCNVTYCHSNGNGGAGVTAVNWGSTATNTCGVCHNKAGDASWSGTVAHLKHVTSNNAAGTYTCDVCHIQTATNNTTIKDKTKHINKFKNVSGTLINNSYKVLPIGTCTTSCHGKTTPKWSETSTGCNFCHPYDVGSWNLTAQRWTGQMSFTNEGFGAHEKHISHIKTLTSSLLTPLTDIYGSGAAAAVCGACHTNTKANHVKVADFSGTTTAQFGLRAINFGDSAFKTGGATGFSFLFGSTNSLYNGTSDTSSSSKDKSCSNLSCHYFTSPVWSSY